MCMGDELVSTKICISVCINEKHAQLINVFLFCKTGKKCPVK